MSTQPNDIERLVSLALGELEPAAAQEVRRRLEQEPALRETYERLAQGVSFLRAETGAAPSDDALQAAKRLLRDARPGAMERLSDGLRRLVASLDFDTRLTPAMAGIRGGATAAQVAFSSEAADIDLEITQGEGETWMIAGQIDADEEGDWSITIVDRASEGVVREIHARDGAFRVELEAGSYALRLRRGGLEIEVGPLQIP
ncbi:MAG: hypothetical protein R3B57_08685 [Phycisphaerales bacterium]